MPAETPKVLAWFKAYSALFAALYLACAGCSLIFFLVDPGMLEPGTTKGEAILVGLILLLIGLVFAAAFTLPFFLQPRPWVWIYDLVLICIGLTSPCCMPASIPLLIYWLKPEVKTYFGRKF
jgi:hypothetical protein